MKSAILSVLLVITLLSSAQAVKVINDLPVLTTLEEHVDPAHTAVIVVDMQNEIVSMEGKIRRKDRHAPANLANHEVAPSYAEQVKNMQAFLEKARSNGLPIIYAQYIHKSETGKMLVNGPEYWTHRKADWVSCAVAGTWESATIKELAPHEGDVVINKSRANTFYNTYLDDVLKEKGIQCLLLTGTAGGGCVFATAMGAMDRGYYASFVKDCVDQPTYIDSDLIKGRFAVYDSEQVYTAWNDLSASEDTEKLSTREFLELFLYEPKNVDDYISGNSYSFAKYNGELGILHRSRRYPEGIDDSYCIYNYDENDARQMIMHGEKPCRINTYGSSFAMGEGVSDAETWQEIIAAHLDEPVRNFGVGGYSTYHNYLRIQREEARTPSDYIVLDLGNGDHCLNLVPWQRIRFRADTDKAFHTTMPYLIADPDTGQLEEMANPCPTPESLHNLCNLDWVHNRFKDDYLVKLLMGSNTVQSKALEMIRKSTEMGLEKLKDFDDEFQNALIWVYPDPDYNRRSQWSSMRIIEKIEEYAAANGKKILYVLSYGPIDLQMWLDDGERFDKPFADFMRQSGVNYIDMMDVHKEDFKKYKVSSEEYFERFFNHHSYGPMGNQFKAFVIKDRLVEMMDPKPVPYRD